MSYCSTVFLGWRVGPGSGRPLPRLLPDGCPGTSPAATCEGPDGLGGLSGDFGDASRSPQVSLTLGLTYLATKACSGAGRLDCVG